MAVAPELFQVDKLTCDIFSILENKFLFGSTAGACTNGRVRILTIDGGASTDCVVAAAALARLEDFIRSKSGDSSASIVDYFDVAAGSGFGGILAAMLFTRVKDNKPMFTARAALEFMAQKGRGLFKSEARSRKGLGCFFPSAVGKEAYGRKKKILDELFGELTLKDTIKPVLIPCYDLSSRAPFLFSRADALEVDGYDFKMSDVCAATSADPSAGTGAVEIVSVDGKTSLVGVDGGVAMKNPTAAAITHVLNNKMEFPLCNGVEDLLVVSLGSGEADMGIDMGKRRNPMPGVPPPTWFVKVAGDGASDVVDQAVALAFGQCRSSNYVRIQAMAGKNKRAETSMKSQKCSDSLGMVDEMLYQKNVESVLFQGKKVAGSTNLEKLEAFAGDVVKEQERRSTSMVPVVVLKQSSSTLSPSPRSSSATTLSTSSSC